MVAVQVYWPLSDILRGEKVCSTEVVSVTDTTVELGNTMLIYHPTRHNSGCTVQRVGLASNGVPRE